MTQLKFKDKIAVVTGAASGLGLAIAERLAADGAKVVVCDINAGAGKEVAARLGGTFVQADMSRRADCRALIDQALAAYGTVHILVNNAGFQNVETIEAFPEDVWDKMQAVMLTAPFLLTKYVWPAMRKQRWGRIINICSIHGLVASPNKVAYISAKHGMVGLTKTAALEGARSASLRTRSAPPMCAPRWWINRLPTRRAPAAFRPKKSSRKSCSSRPRSSA